MEGRVRIAAAEGLVYLPHYLGILQGHFARSGVDVVLVHQEPGRSSITDLLLQDKAELVLGSLVHAHALSRRTPATIVALSNRQTRHFLFRRTGDLATEPFDWATLRGRTVVVEPASVPTSWVAFIAGLRRADLRLDDVRTLVGFTPGAVLDEFLAGTGDYFLAGIGSAVDDRVKIVAPLAEVLGPAPWSVYCATTRWAERQPSVADSFVDGLGRAMQWLAEARHQEVREAAIDCFPNEDLALVDVTIDHYRRIGFWAADPHPNLDDLARWETDLQAGGLLPADSGLTRMVRLAEGVAS